MAVVRCEPDQMFFQCLGEDNAFKKSKRNLRVGLLTLLDSITLYNWII